MDVRKEQPDREKTIAARARQRAIGRELRRIYADYKPTIAYYDERARNPRNAITGVEFADRLKKQRQPETA